MLSSKSRTQVGSSRRTTLSNWRYRPKLAVGDFLSDWPQYFVSRRSLNSSRRTEFGANGRCRISTRDVSKIAADRPLQKCDSARTTHCRHRAEPEAGIETDPSCPSDRGKGASQHSSAGENEPDAAHSGLRARSAHRRVVKTTVPRLGRRRGRSCLDWPDISHVPIGAARCTERRAKTSRSHLLSQQPVTHQTVIRCPTDICRVGFSSLFSL